MTEEQQQFIKRIRELEESAYKNSQYLFTDFLNEAEYADAMDASSRSGFVSAWGGWEGAQRRMVRFGSPEEFGYDQPWPVVVLRISPLLEKFAEDLNHRDFLGAILNLGIERRVIGDIVIEGRTGYVFVKENIAQYVAEALTKIRHTNVKCKQIEELPQVAVPKMAGKEIQVTSARLDAIVAQVCSFSRSAAQEAFRQEHVCVNGRVQQNLTYMPKDGDVISVRGFGKFRVDGEIRMTKKGKHCLGVELYQ